MNPSRWYQYRKCPTCSGSFGRGKGLHGLARHICDDPLMIKLRALLVAHFQAALGHSIIEARLKKKLKDREARLKFVLEICAWPPTADGVIRAAGDLKVRAWRSR